MRRTMYCLLTVWLTWLAAAPALPAKDLADQLFYGVESQLRGRNRQAADAFAAALAQAPDNAYARARLGLALAELGQTGQSREVLEQALVADGRDLAALWTLGCLDLADGHGQSAATRFSAMAQADPGNARAALGLGLTAALSGRTDEAVRRLAEAQAADSQDPATRYLTGLAYWLLDAPVNARLELEAALELAPRFTPALDLLGQVYRRQGKPGLAKSAWEQALALSGDDARARFYLSRLAQDEGLEAVLADRPEAARRAYVQALEIDRSNEGAAAGLAGLGPPRRTGGAPADGGDPPRVDGRGQILQGAGKRGQ